MLVGVVNSFAGPIKEHTWELGTEVSHIKYEEPGVMEDEGIMYGIFGSYTYRNNYMLKAEGKYSYGQVDYEGSLSDGTPYTLNDIDDFMLEFRGLGGYDFSVLKATILTPYIGFGYRYLNDDTSFNIYGYERESNYYYTPIGIQTMTPLTNGWSVGLTVEYDYFWKGVQKTHLDDLNPLYNTLENDQKDGYGCRGSIKFQKEGDSIDFAIEPFIRYWDIDESELSAITVGGTYVVAYGYEPANESTEFGIKFAAKF
ncbi:MAG: autotransporter outer membrane beta-barrel domain-containing protein [Candidatus Omnitrophica bacterium]|nr:autotransporter outer membrane beta-barrel domain-containing protein [Candidatus Omnitrophota bacterium]